MCPNNLSCFIALVLSSGIINRLTGCIIRLLLAGPGPALFVAASGFPKVMYYWWPANLIGVVLAEQAKKLF